MRNKANFLWFFIITLILSFHFAICKNSRDWPKRVLITNDNGIDDIKIQELAKAFSKISETYVIAPDSNKSGSTHYLGALRNGSIKVEQVNISHNIKAYSVSGYPADCVALALAGIMKDNPPDLVISGINGGPNLGTDWLSSGTIGAARMASVAGVPAIAVSGLKSDIPGSIQAAIKWIVNFVQSPIVQDLKPPAYITVSIPRIPPNEIKGIQVAYRSDFQEIPILDKIQDGNSDDVKEIWQIKGIKKLSATPPSDSDISFYERGYIVIVPMLASEVDYQTLNSLKQKINDIPKWQNE